MNENAPGTPETPAPQGDSQRLTYVLLVVLIICGGNGLGILAAGLVWKFTQNIAGAIIAVVAITIVAFISAMALVVHHNKKQN